jgi:FkbM family methyltransferase
MIIEPKIHGLDPIYFDRRRGSESALKWSGVVSEPRFVIDVGANVGQTLETFLSWWPSARCLSLEPLPDAFAELQGVVSKYSGRAEAINCGVGSKPGKLGLNASKTQSTTSSFNKLNKSAETAQAHHGLRSTPSFLELGAEDNYEVEVSVAKLDDILTSFKNKSATWFNENGVDIFKIDTQGWELEVLRGATEVLKRTKVVLTEWQFDDIYGQPPPLHELDKILSDAGFRLWDISHIYKDLKTMRTLWVDLIYAKPSG